MTAGREIPLVAQAGSKPDQVGILVSDLMSALPRWGPAGGWRIWEYGPEVLTRQEPAGFSMRVALSGTVPEIELIEPVDGPSIYLDWIEEHGYGIHHLGYVVEDVAATIEVMEAAGFPVIQFGFGFGSDRSGGFAYFDTRPHLDVIVEAIERPRARRSPEAEWP